MKKKIVIKESELDSLVKEVLQENEQFEGEPNVVVELVKEKIMEVQTFLDSVNINNENVFSDINKFWVDILSPLMRELQKLNKNEETYGEFQDEMDYLYDVDEHLNKCLEILDDIKWVKQNKPTPLY